MGKLYTFWRSSASYRVRILLNLKGLDYTAVPIHFRKEGGQHRKPGFLTKNSQGLLPVWEDDDWSLSQSLAIMEYLDEMHPAPPLLPANAKARAEVRAISQAIACDIHPLNNLRVMAYLKQQMGQSEDQVKDWYQHWVALGFDALETDLKQTAGEYCYGDQITIADCCLVPQVYNAQRFDCDMVQYPTIRRINETLNMMEAFQKATPENQSDADNG
jgi:maleylacetoacetate isomerase